MKHWTLIALLLCFSFLISALPLPQQFAHHAINSGQYILDKRADSDLPVRVKTPTPEDSPHVPPRGTTGAYYDAENKMVWAFYGDTLRQHAHHILINHHLNPVNRLPMERADVLTHQRNRRVTLKNIPTQPGMARDEKPAAMFVPVAQVPPTVMMVSAKESSAEGALLSKVAALMDKHEVSLGAVRANVGFIFKPKEDMKLGISAPPKFPMFSKAGAPKKRRARKAQQQPKMVKDPYKYLADPTYKGDAHHPIVNGGMRLRKRKQTRTVPVFVNGVVQTVKKEYKGSNVNENKKHDVRFKKNFLIHPEPIVPLGQAWRPAQGDGPTHAGAPLPHTDVEDRRPEKFKDHAHYMNFKKEQEEKQAKDKLEADKRRRVTQEAPEARLASKQPSALPILAPRPVSPTNLLEKMNALRIGSDDTHAGSGKKAVASSSHSHPDAHVGGSKTVGHGSASNVGGGKHVPIKHNKSLSPAAPVPPSAPPTHHSPPVHVQDDSPPAHNTRSLGWAYHPEMKFHQSHSNLGPRSWTVFTSFHAGKKTVARANSRSTMEIAELVSTV